MCSLCPPPLQIHRVARNANHPYTFVGFIHGDIKHPVNVNNQIHRYVFLIQRFSQILIWFWRHAGITEKPKTHIYIVCVRHASATAVYTFIVLKTIWQTTKHDGFTCHICVWLFSWCVFCCRRRETRVAI